MDETGKWRALLKLMRPHQYVKNLFIFAPLFFGVQQINGLHVINTLFAFIAFCFTASAIYILNDWVDLPLDQQHPQKKHRPLAAGIIQKRTALLLMIILFMIGLMFIALLKFTIFYWWLLYIAINLAYTFKLKQWVIVDVCVVSVGYVLRLFVGSITSSVVLSQWIVIMTFLLALFLSFGKRRADVLLFENQHVLTRQTTERYTLPFLNATLGITSSIVIVAYLMYTVSPQILTRTYGSYFYITVLFVLLGILRYLQITLIDEKGADPTEIFLHDLPLQATVLGWLACLTWFLYL